MIEIARNRDCSNFFSNIYIFDTCIGKIQPCFDTLSLEDKTEVAMKFLVFSDLQTGSSIVFSELIHPYQSEIIEELKTISDRQLQLRFSIGKRKIEQYRKRVEIYANRNLPRGSQGTGMTPPSNTKFGSHTPLICKALTFRIK